MKFTWWNIFSWPIEIRRLKDELDVVKEVLETVLEQQEDRRDEYIPSQERVRDLVAGLLGGETVEEFHARNQKKYDERRRLRRLGAKDMPKTTDAEAHDIVEGAKNSFIQGEPTMTMEEYDERCENGNYDRS